MFDIIDALKIDELRARFLVHTRKAYRSLSLPDRPRILDIGCGRGLPTIELARLSGGDVVGIDTDAAALCCLRQRIEQEGLTEQVTIISGSFFDSGIDDESFDLLWAEGVLHQLNPSTGFRECSRLLKPNGFLMMHECVAWLKHVRGMLPRFGFRYEVEQPLPKHYWWTEYGAPLEERIRAFREANENAVELEQLAPFEQEVARLKANPSRFDCAYAFYRRLDG